MPHKRGKGLISFPLGKVALFPKKGKENWEGNLNRPVWRFFKGISKIGFPEIMEP